MKPSKSPGLAGVRMSCPADGSKSTVPMKDPATKNDPSAPIAAATLSTDCVASGVVPRYPGKQVPPLAKLVSQSGLVLSQLPNPAAQTAALHELALLHVNSVFAIAHDGSPHPAQSESVPRYVEQ